MEVVLLNAVSLNMLPPSSDVGQLTYSKITLRQAADICLEHVLTVNAIGHADTDYIVRTALASEGCLAPEGKRMDVTLSSGKIYLVAQYRGPRLPEGAKELPKGTKLEWYRVRFESFFDTYPN